MEFFHQSGDVIAERYQILSLLGQGGSGITYIAQDLQTQQQVVLKALSLRHLNDWKQLELFEREARILEQLNHPAIPRYLDYFQVDATDNRAFYIAQELAVGESLATLVEKGWRTNEQEVRQIAAQVLEILVYLHSLTPPVIHRDIKPQNLIRSKTGKISLVDFGAVQDTYRSTLVKGSTVVGTYGYMAPEQFRGQAVVGTDLYALGATLLFLLTHRPPSDLPQERLRISFRNRVKISDSFATWLEKLLEPHAENRFRSAREALTALRQKVLLSKPIKPVPIQRLMGGGIAGVFSLVLLVIFRYPAMKLVGIVPPNVCAANVEEIKSYLDQWGDPKEVTRCLMPLPEGLKRVSDTENPMHDLFVAAVQTGNLELVKFLLNKGINLKGPPSHHPITIAAGNGNLELVKFLLDKGFDPNGIPWPLAPNTTQISYPPLTAAVQSRKLELVKLLLDKGASPNVSPEFSYPPLIAAVDTGKLELVKLLLDKGASPNAVPRSPSPFVPEFSYPPLIKAVAASNLEMVKLLLNKGANVNVKTPEGETPLSIALYLHQSAIVSLLKKYGAKR